MAIKKDEKVDIVTIKQERIQFYVKGETPLICNRLSEKAKRELLLPKQRANRAELAMTAKHDPVAEFRASPYKLQSGKTLISMPSTAFKGALRSVAIDMPGATKAQLGRLTYVEGEQVEIFGVPKMFLSVVRNAGMNRTPDIRSRAILAEWAAVVTIKFTTPMLNAEDISNLFAASGMVIGVGDWRPEKGSGNYGTFSIVDPDDKDFQRIVKAGGREVQERAMISATPYNAETEELLEWFSVEVGRRGLAIAK